MCSHGQVVLYSDTMAFPSVETITAMVTPLATAHGMDVESVRITKAGKKSLIAIAVDSDFHPGLDDLEVFSQEVSACLDAAEERGELRCGAGYTLEVSTPGVDMPLTEARHWRRNRGRLVNLEGEWFRIGPLSEDEFLVALIQGGDVSVRELALLPPGMVEVEFGQPPAGELGLVQQDFSTLTGTSTSK